MKRRGLLHLPLGYALAALAPPVDDSALVRPRAEPLACLVRVEWTLVHAQLEQPAIRLPDERSGWDAERLADLCAIQIGTDPVELLLLAQPRYAVLKDVVGMRQGRSLALVAGRAVRAHEHVE